MLHIKPGLCEGKKTKQNTSILSYWNPSFPTRKDKLQIILHPKILGPVPFCQ